MAFGFEYQEVSLSLSARSRVGTVSCVPEHRARVMLARRSSCQAVVLLIVHTIAAVCNIFLTY